MYVPFHVHSMLSNGVTNIDSITNFREYVKAAKDCGMPAFGISEHGSCFEWVHKKESIEAAGMKYIHAVEAYLTEDDNTKFIYKAVDLFRSTLVNRKKDVEVHFTEWDFTEDGKCVVESLEDGKCIWIDPNTIEKYKPIRNRDNYHCVLIAKNLAGVKEINKMISKSFCREDEHFYYMPRMTFDELFATSDNVIVTTACLGGVLHNGNPAIKERMLGFLTQNKHRCYLEIQHHNCKEQIEYNRFLYEVSQSTGIPLIVGTDTHALNKDHLIGRSIMQKAKTVSFEDEDDWDLTFKTPEQLVEAYQIQDSLPMSVVLEAMQNTIVMADSIEPFEIDRSPKYPKLYDDSEGVFKQKINEGVISRGVNKYPNYSEYVDRIHYEYDTYKHNGAIDFMLLEENYKSEMRRRGIRFGYSRGSVSGSIIAYLLGITEIDSIKYNLNFDRFMNKERISLADVDTDWFSEDRDTVKDYLHQKDGLYCCDIVTFNTIALKGAVKDVCRGLHYDNLAHLPGDVKDEVKKWDKMNADRTKDNGPGYIINDLPYPPELAKKIKKYSIHSVPLDYLNFAEKIISIAEEDESKAREEYKEIFWFVDLVNGCVVSVGNHPAGCVVSPYPVDEWFGTFTTKEDKYPISLLNMKEIDSLNFVKLDILGLDNVGLIYKTCDLAGIPYLTPDNTPADDINVWNSIREDTTLIFQWESPSATAYLKQLLSDETISRIKEKNPNFSYMDLLSIGNGAIRPAGESYRDKLSHGIYESHNNKELDEFMKPTLGYMVYQCQIIEFLNIFCGFTKGEADLVRRHFSKKLGTETDIPVIENGGYLLTKGKDGELHPMNDHHIDGFVKTMKEKYNVTEEESEKIIVNFLQVIEDASDYLFSKNHADPYSWIGYVCGYLRYYYPIEFLTVALNIFQGKEDKSLAITEYAKKHGFKISPIKFRYSVAEYGFDKETKQIFKGIASIKFMNAAVADELYTLRNNQYNSFMELLFDISDKTTLNARQIKILIELDFFSEFGDANYLMAQYRMFDKFNDKKQFKKEDIDRLGIPVEIVRRFSEKETAKLFKEIDMKSILINIAGQIQYTKRSLKERISSQIEHLGYVDVVGDEYKGMGALLDINTKYTPKAKVYSLKNGSNVECKIDKRFYNRNKIERGDIIKITETKNKQKMRKSDDGGFEPVPGVMELWITKYTIINNI